MHRYYEQAEQNITKELATTNKAKLQDHMAQLKSIVANRDLKAKLVQFAALASAMEVDVEGRRALRSADQGRSEAECFRNCPHKPPTPQPSKPKKPVEAGDNQERRFNQAISVYNQGLKVLWKPNSIPIMPLISFPKQSTAHSNPVEDRAKASAAKKSRGGVPVAHKYKMYVTSKRPTDATSVSRKNSYKNSANSNRSTRSTNQLAGSVRATVVSRSVAPYATEGNPKQQKSLKTECSATVLFLIRVNREKAKGTMGVYTMT